MTSRRGAGLLLVAGLAVGCGDSSARPAAASQPWPPLLRGLAISLHDDARLEEYTRQIDEIADLGAEAVSMLYPAYQHTGRSTVIFLRAWAPRLETIGRLIDHAHARGLRVFFLPLVLVANPTSEDDWRGRIEPADWDAWFRHYRAHLCRLADLAQRHRIDLLSVGSELSSSETLTDQWVRTILAVRARYSGRLIYSANWDHYEHVEFWSYLDFLGLSTYFELRAHNRGQPTVDELVAAWRRIQQELLSWQQAQGRPLILTEIGYASVDGCARYPWDFDGSRTAGHEGAVAAIDLEEQAICYQALARAWADVPGLAGLFIYSWEGVGGPTDRGYTVRGKPAESVLRQWFHAGR